MNATRGLSVILVISLLCLSFPFGIFAQTALGEVMITGNATINRIKATSGNTIFSNSEIETLKAGAAVVSFRQGAGLLAIESNSRVRLTGQPQKVSAEVSKGLVTLRTKLPAFVTTPQIQIKSGADSAYSIAVTNSGTEVKALTRAVRVTSNKGATVVAPGEHYTSWTGSVVNSQSKPRANLLISEVDADQGDNDNQEFIELFDGGIGDTPLDGVMVVFYDGKTDNVYGAYDLAGRITDGRGYFVLGNSGVRHVNMIFPDNTLKDADAAVAIFKGSPSSFSRGSMVTTVNLLDAFVYSNKTESDAGLLKLLNPGQPQVNENSLGNAIGHSSQRCNIYSCQARDTVGYLQARPTPGTDNDCSGSLAQKQAPQKRRGLIAFLWPLIAGGVALPVALAVATGEESPAVSPTTPQR